MCRRRKYFRWTSVCICEGYFHLMLLLDNIYPNVSSSLFWHFFKNKSGLKKGTIKTRKDVMEMWWDKVSGGSSDAVANRSGAETQSVEVWGISVQLWEPSVKNPNHFLSRLLPSLPRPPSQHLLQFLLTVCSPSSLVSCRRHPKLLYHYLDHRKRKLWDTWLDISLPLI